MMDESRPDPDLLLAAVRDQEARARGGRLAVFFGMAAGVGKTYAMLRAAQDERAKGVDVVIGLVETHGRPETTVLTEGLPVVPRRRVPYRGTILEEMDLDAILARHPQLVLVDELAHTNVPGSRHPKRWQDVLEMLAGGIDVFTTINVQHLESRKETIEAITGVTIREGVPDSVLEHADRVILIDITPQELLQRLREGKVYLGERAETALAHFFKEDRLTALREVALRFTAERVDHDLRMLRATGDAQTAWKPRERLMVAISHSPSSEALIRATRRLAYSLEAPWIALYVDTGQTLSASDRDALARNIALVRDLGGELATTIETDIAGALERVARGRQVTQLVIGRPTRRWLRDALTGGTVVDRLVKKSRSFDVLVLRSDPASRRQPSLRTLRGSFTPGNVAKVVAIVAMTAIVSGLVTSEVGYHTTGFFFLFGVLAVSLFAPIGLVVLGALVSAVIWDVFFIPPYGALRIFDPADLAMCIAFLVVALTTGTLMQRVRRNQRMLRTREQRLELLNQVAQAVAMRRARSEYLPIVTELIGEAIGCTCSVGVATRGGDYDHVWRPPVDWVADDKERAVVAWVLQNRSSAGWSTDTLAGSAALYIPLGTAGDPVGVLACKPDTGVRLLPEEGVLLASVAHQLGVALERELLGEKARQVDLLRESERLHETILNAVSHEIRTPLTAMIGAAAALEDSATMPETPDRMDLVRQITENGERLNRVIENLLDQSRLDSGHLLLRRDWHDVGDLAGIALESAKLALAAHRIRLDFPDSLPLVRIDLSLFERVLINLLVNAATYAPAGTTVEIGAGIDQGSLSLWVSDEGPGIPVDALPRVFERFHRVPSQHQTGVGIGLSIAKGIVELHGGTIAASNNTAGGSRFTIRLPVADQPPMPAEKPGR